MIQGLDRARWAVLNPFLDEALELPPAARPAWLEALRERDPALGADIEELLSEYGRVAAEDFLGTGPAPLATLAGQTIGAYTLETCVGRGGMGSVWLAHRSDGRFDGAMAVKLLNVSLMGPGAENRFRREGSILARLRHTHIAQLLDAGVSPAGQPYLVLEHVDGEHIGAHCDRLRLGVEARVRLFLDVLAAVAHAHANLIVHRDLKPSNVLVRRDGVVKLLDFGVAKLLATDADAGPVTLTLEGGALTPEYAAPEQLQGGDITTATDVFALGILLYELLAGRHPAGEALRASPVDLIRTMLDREAPRLSADTVAAAAAARGATPEALRRALRGDLETIVTKALKKAPAERYASVAALADDLRAFLAHAPIRARPDTLGYRSAKFVRRHRLPVVLSAVLAVALAAGVAGTTWQAREASRERDLALAQLTRAESLNLFTEFLLGQAVPNGQPVTIHEIMARGEQLAEKRAAHDPALAVDVLVSIGSVYAVLEETDNTQRTMKRAFELSQTVSDPATRASAACGWARALNLGGDPAAALREIDAGLALTSADARFDSVVVNCLLHRAAIAMSTPSHDLVLDAAREALARLDRRPQAYPELRANVLEMYAQGLRDAGDQPTADRTFAQAFDQIQRVGRGESTDAAALLNNWAINSAYSNPVAGFDKYRQAVDVLGGGSSDAVPIPMLYNYAVALCRLARYGEARPVLERMQALSRQHGHAAGVTLSAVKLAYVCTALGDLACTRRNLQLAEDGLSASPTARGELTRQRGLLAAAEGRGADAHGLLLAALPLLQERRTDRLPCVDVLLDLSRLEVQQGSAAEAEAHARAALAGAEGFRGGAAHSSWVGRSLLALGAALQARGDAAGARTLLTQAVVHMTPTLGAEHPDLAEAQRRLAP